METLTRQEVLQFLYSMGVELPPATKLPNAAINQRLDQALKLSQELPEIFPSPASPTLKIASLGDWPSGRLRVARAIARANVEEAVQRSMLNADLSDGDVDVFGGLRQIIGGLADNWDKKMKYFVMNDPDDQTSFLIAIRVRHAPLSCTLTHLYC